MDETENLNREYRFLDGTSLKLIALVTMLVDHVGDIFFPGVTWMRAIGRIAMPLFAFCVAEGYSYTRNRLKYLRTLVIFGVISEIPFDLAFEGRIGPGHQNIMFSFALSVAALMVYDRIVAKKNDDGKTDTWRQILGVFAILAFSLLSVLMALDYSLFAVIAVFLFYVFRNRHFLLHRGAGVLFLTVTRTMGYYPWAGLSIIPLLFYNGKRGRGMKWLFYAFYPGHLLILYLIKRVIG